MTTERVGDGREEGAAVVEGWLPAALKAVGLLLLAMIGFMFIPNRMLSYLSLHVAPRTRDTLVTLWIVAFFTALSLLFTRVQRRPRA